MPRMFPKSPVATGVFVYTLWQRAVPRSEAGVARRRPERTARGSRPPTAPRSRAGSAEDAGRADQAPGTPRAARTIRSCSTWWAVG